MNTTLTLAFSLLLATAVTGAMAAESGNAKVSHFQPYPDSTGGRAQSHGELGTEPSAADSADSLQRDSDASRSVQRDPQHHASTRLVPDAGRWSDQRSAS